MSKKTEVITFRTEEWIKDQLQIAAEQNKWSIAQTVEELCKKFIANPQPESIVVKTNDLKKLITEAEKSHYQAIKILIDLEADEDKMEIHKTLNIIGLEAGGWGQCYDFDNIKGLTREEIINIP